MDCIPFDALLRVKREVLPMFIFFFVVALTVGAEPAMWFLRDSPSGRIHQFDTMAGCQIAEVEQLAKFRDAPFGLMDEHGCAKLAERWDA